MHGFLFRQFKQTNSQHISQIQTLSLKSHPLVRDPQKSHMFTQVHHTPLNNHQMTIKPTLNWMEKSDSAEWSRGFKIYLRCDVEGMIINKAIDIEPLEMIQKIHVSNVFGNKCVPKNWNQVGSTKDTVDMDDCNNWVSVTTKVWCDHPHFCNIVWLLGNVAEPVHQCTRVSNVVTQMRRSKWLTTSTHACWQAHCCY